MATTRVLLHTALPWDSRIRLPESETYIVTFPSVHGVPWRQSTAVLTVLTMYATYCAAFSRRQPQRSMMANGIPHTGLHTVSARHPASIGTAGSAEYSIGIECGPIGNAVPLDTTIVE